MRFGKLDNTSTDPMRQILSGIPDLVPKRLIILFTFGNDSRLAALACNAS